MTIKDKILEMRCEVLQKITDIVKSVGDALWINDLDETISPIIQELPGDESDNIFTLDRIILENGNLTFLASSSWSDFDWSDRELSIEILVGVLEFLEDHKEQIEELKS